MIVSSLSFSFFFFSLSLLSPSPQKSDHYPIQSNDLRGSFCVYSSHEPPTAFEKKSAEAGITNPCVYDELGSSPHSCAKCTQRKHKPSAGLKAMCPSCSHSEHPVSASSNFISVKLRHCSIEDNMFLSFC